MLGFEFPIFLDVEMRGMRARGRAEWRRDSLPWESLPTPTTLYVRKEVCIYVYTYMYVYMEGPLCL